MGPFSGEAAHFYFASRLIRRSTRMVVQGQLVEPAIALVAFMSNNYSNVCL